MHLGPGVEPRSLRALSAVLGRGDLLLVLGDFFDLWYENLWGCCKGHGKSLDAIRSLVEGGVEVILLAGNRDFLAGPVFCGRTGAGVLRGPAILDSPGGRVLLLHGDELIPQDKSYQCYKRIVRSRPIVALSRIFPLFLLSRLAGGIRRKSIAKLAGFPENLFAPDEALISAMLDKTGSSLAVAGHIHEEKELALPGGRRCIFLPAGSDAEACFCIWDGRALSSTRRTEQ